MFLLHDRIYVQQVDYQNRFNGRSVIVSPLFANAIYPNDTSTPKPDLLANTIDELFDGPLYESLLSLTSTGEKVFLYVDYETYMNLYLSHVTFLCNAFNVPNEVDYLMATKELHIKYSTPYEAPPRNNKILANVDKLFVSDPTRISLEMMLFFYRKGAYNETEQQLAQAKLFSMIDRWVYQRFWSTRFFLIGEMYHDPLKYKTFFNQTFDDTAMSNVQYINKVKKSLDKSEFFTLDSGFTAEHAQQYYDFQYRFYVDTIKMFEPEHFEKFFEYDYKEWAVMLRYLKKEISLLEVADFISQYGSRLYHHDANKFNMWPTLCLR